MKNYSLLIALIMAVVSCNTKQQEEKVVTKDSAIATAEADTAAVKKDNHYFWSSEFDNKGLLMIKVRPLPEDSLTAASIIQLQNDLYPEIQVRFDRMSNDTIFVTIPNSTYLTQQTGSSGPEGYFAELTYNLTELKNITYVDIRFKRGDHAQPGTFSRTDFVKGR
jgi:hypothetical protein